MSVTLYHNPRCSKSRAALALLEARGIAPTVVEYLKTPPTAEEFQAILDKLGLPARAVLRVKEARDEGIDPDGLDEAALVAAMVAHPRVIERPIAVAGDAARLGRPPETVLDLL
jgi:arsenate reductase